MTEKELMITISYAENDVSISLTELCEICGVSSNYISDLIAYEIIHPQGKTPRDWTFNLRELQRIKRAVRLQRDLDVNLAGIAILLDLLDEMDRLRIHSNVLERHFLK